jgi:hypothetical protein
MSGRRVSSHRKHMSVARSRTHAVVCKVNMTDHIAIRVVDSILNGISGVRVKMRVNRIWRRAFCPWFARSRIMGATHRKARTTNRGRFRFGH